LPFALIPKFATDWHFAQGTAQFMALEVLEAISQGTATVPRDVHHDLESLLWVIMYAIYKYCINVDGNNEELKKEFKTFFGATSMEKIVMIHYYAISRGQPKLRKCLRGLGQERLFFVLLASSDLLLYQNPAVQDDVTPQMQAYFNRTRKGKTQERAVIAYADLFDMLDAAEATVES
jgi:hypothetical protein